ncbi:metal ABC transporter substrate-binding protein [Ideonella livida]|uniref:Metal ABC transporter substrate-binding protein n=1 Tax=Ideonella livida TaxID=2707176 RepID=A0A7C9PI88_9BURK|nr:metal ABC transporter substrate-binding protein [Ideonella livida]NDY91754.1 metal ABC transporter substrate-binding protein [Ideonella livida]
MTPTRLLISRPAGLRRRAALGLALGSALPPVLAQPDAAATPAATPPLRVVASFSILADLVAQVAGPVAEVSALVGPDADAHVYQPTPADVRRLAQADLVVVNGLHFEGWLQRLVRSAGYRGPVLVVSQDIQPRQQGGHADPHAWQSLGHARRYVARIAQTLQGLRPGQAASLQARAQAYDQQLAALDQRLRADFAALPPERRRLITGHDAFGYLAEAYGLTLLAPRGVNTEQDASAADVARIIRQIRSERVPAVFLENVSDPRLVRRLAEEGGARLGGQLYSDALSGPGGPAATYLQLYQHNARTLLEALR